LLLGHQRFDLILDRGVVHGLNLSREVC
jgi:hypothetical protein